MSSIHHVLRGRARARWFGDVRARHDHGAFAITRLRHERGRRLPVHEHEHAYFCLVVRGGYAERFGSSEVRYGPRTVLFHPPGIVHRDEIAAGGASFLLVEIGAELLRRAGVAGRGWASRQDRRGGELAQAALRLEREHRDPARRSPLVIEGLVLEMLGITAREVTAREHRAPWLDAVVERLHAELDRPLTMAALARDAGVPPVRLARAFRRRFGRGVGEYVRELRVRWVEERLGEPDIGIADLATAAGFADQSHLTRVFRRHTGTTPGARRRALRSPTRD
jgi:AraC family transcriptional regulator